MRRQKRRNVNLNEEGEPIADHHRTAWTMQETRVLFEIYRYYNGLFRAQVYTGKKGNRFAHTAELMEKYGYSRSEASCRQRYDWVIKQCQKETQEQEEQTSAPVGMPRFLSHFAEFMTMEEDIAENVNKYIVDSEGLESKRFKIDTKKRSYHTAKDREKRESAPTTTSTSKQSRFGSDVPQATERNVEGEGEANITAGVESGRNRAAESEHSTASGSFQSQPFEPTEMAWGEKVLSVKPEISQSNTSLRSVRIGDVIAYDKSAMQRYSSDVLTGPKTMVAMVMRYGGTTMDVITAENQTVRQLPRIGAHGYVKNVSKMTALDARGQLVKPGDTVVRCSEPSTVKKVETFKVLLCAKNYIFITSSMKKRTEPVVLPTEELRLKTSAPEDLADKHDDFIPSVSDCEASFTNAEMKYWTDIVFERSRTDPTEADAMPVVQQYSAVFYANDVWFCLDLPNKDGLGRYISSTNEVLHIDSCYLSPNVVHIGSEAGKDSGEGWVTENKMVFYLLNSSRRLGKVVNLCKGFCLINRCSMEMHNIFEVVKSSDVTVTENIVEELELALKNDRFARRTDDSRPNPVPSRTAMEAAIEDILKGTASQGFGTEASNIRDGGPALSRRSSTASVSGQDQSTRDARKWRVDAETASDLNAAKNATITRRMMLLVRAFKDDLEQDSIRNLHVMQELKTDALSMAKEFMKSAREQSTNQKSQPSIHTPETEVPPERSGNGTRENPNNLSAQSTDPAGTNNSTSDETIGAGNSGPSTPTSSRISFANDERVAQLLARVAALEKTVDELSREK